MSMAIVLSILSFSSSSLSSSTFNPYNRTFAYAQENPLPNDNSNNKNNISLSNLIKQGSPHLGNHLLLLPSSTSATFNAIFAQDM